MQVRRWGANRNSGSTTIFDKKASTSWNARKNLLSMTISRVNHGTAGEFNYAVEFTVEDFCQMVGALSKECGIAEIAEALEPSVRDLLRLQLAAAGMTPST